MVAVLSLFCVRIRVVGLTSLSEYDVYCVMQDAGAKEFELKGKIDTKRIERAIWKAFPDLTYVYVSFDGASLVAEIRERVYRPEIRDEQPCAVYALKGGVVEKIVVTSGQAAVAPGDQVQEGQLLIAGSYLKGETPITAPARGVILARVDYIAKADATMSSYDKVPTGESAVARYLRLGKREVLLSGSNPFEEFIENTEVVSDVGKNGPLHLQIIEKTYYKAKERLQRREKTGGAFKRGRGRLSKALHTDARGRGDCILPQIRRRGGRKALRDARSKRERIHRDDRRAKRGADRSKYRYIRLMFGGFLIGKSEAGAHHRI